MNTYISLANRIIRYKQSLFPDEYEKAYKQAQKKYVKFYKQFLSPNDLCFDVGANIGNRTEAFLKCGCRVIAIEPQPTCCKYLENKFGDSVDIIAKGLGAKESVEELFIPEASTIATFSTQWRDAVKSQRFKNYSWESSIHVEVTTLNKVIELYGIPIFCKIDVEGFEFEVLKGLNRPIPMISFEYTIPEETENLLNCIGRLHELDKKYKFNFTPNETMQFSLQEFISYYDFLKYVQSNNFINTGWGDIYAKIY